MRRSGVLFMATCVLGAGCLERESAPIGPEIGFVQNISVGGGVGDVDILFVVDNSFSMREEQEKLAVQIPALVRALASPPDRDADGMPDWNAVSSMRIGITTTDTGIGDAVITGSRCAGSGDDGNLRDGVFSWSPDGSESAQAFADRVGATVTSLGIEGCSFEQPLEAAARAVARQDETGFPARDRLFAVIVVSDEEDCSIEDDTAFFSSIPTTDLNAGCSMRAGELTPVGTLLDRIRGDRGDGEFLFASIVGVPTSFAPDARPEDILAAPTMTYAYTGTSPRLVPVCEFTDVGATMPGTADPARRAVELAALVPDSVVTTICTDDFGPAIAEVAERLGSRISGVCLARALPDTADFSTACAATVRLPAGVVCTSFGSYTFEALDGDRELCSIPYAAEGSGAEGFFYDSERDGCPQLVLTEGAIPPVGSDVWVDCFFPVLKPLGDQCARASQCESGFCDGITNSCTEPPAIAPLEEPPLGG